MAKTINQSLHGFSTWFDDFLLEVAKPLAIVGFAMGTVDIFTRGGIATNPWFNVPWAIVQAVTIDGLFFAVWYRIASTKWTKATWGSNAMLVFIGGVLALVAMITNGILSLQQLQGIKDSISAMAWIGIDPIAFTIGRAVLVVFVSIMVAFVYHQKENSVVPNSGTAIVLPEQNTGTVLVPIVPPVEQWNTDWNSLPEQWNTFWNSGTPEEQWMEHPGTLLFQGRTVVEQLPEQRNNPVLIAEHSEQSDRNRLLDAMRQAQEDKRPINLKMLSEELGIAYPRVRKLSPAIKKEMGI